MMLDTTKESYDHSECLKFLKAVSPMRMNELECLIRNYNIELFWKDNDDFDLYTVFGAIPIPVTPIPRLLLQTYGFLAKYQVLCESIGEEYLADDLLDAAIDDDLAVIRKATNATTFDLKEIASGVVPHEDTMELAGDITTMAIGAYLLHEIGHNVYPESDKSQAGTPKEEFFADDWAFDFIFSQAQPYAKSNGVDETLVRMKMAIAMVLAFCRLMFPDLYLGVKESHTHPFSGDRLFRQLDTYCKDPNKCAWALASVVLEYHLKRADCPASSFLSFGTYKDAAQRCFELIASRKRTNGH